jgi:hypothetical protein
MERESLQQGPIYLALLDALEAAVFSIVLPDLGQPINLYSRICDEKGYLPQLLS